MDNSTVAERVLEKQEEIVFHLDFFETRDGAYHLERYRAYDLSSGGRIGRSYWPEHNTMLGAIEMIIGAVNDLPDGVSKVVLRNYHPIDRELNDAIKAVSALFKYRWGTYFAPKIELKGFLE